MSVQRFYISSTVVLGITLSGCATQRSISRDGDTLARDRDAEYSVYSFLIGIDRSSRVRIVDDSTTRPFNGRVLVCSDPEYRTGFCLKPHPGTSPEAWADFARKNRSRALLLPLFAKELNVTMARDAKQVEETCSQPIRFSFSRPGFNADRTEAVIEVSYAIGHAPFPGCGFMSGELLVLKRTPNGWKQLVLVHGMIT